MRRLATHAGTLAALALLLLAGCTGHDARSAFHDPDRSIYIPAENDLVRTLRVSAVYDDREIQIRYEFPTKNPSWYHQYWIFENGAWNRYGGTDAGPDPLGLYEDRISMALDAGHVPEYDVYGGFLVTHPGVRSRTDAIGREASEAHPHIGETLGENDVRKFLADSREDGDLDTRWERVRTEEELVRLREQGRFLDTWQWRAHRSNPVGYADNGYVLDYRLSAEGRSMYATNANEAGDAPAWVFDPEAAGVRALRKDRLLARAYTQDDPYFLTESMARPYDPDADWREGDVIPYRLLREPSGSRGAIRASGRWADGAWRVRVTRTLQTPNPIDSHTLTPGQRYTVQFAAHADATGARWHYVSAPLTLGIGPDAGEATLRAVRAPSGVALDDAPGEWVTLPVFYPGQVGVDEIRSNPSLDRAVRAAAARPTDKATIRRLAERLADNERRDD
ncbi:MAG: hypothetical protein EA378_10055 [Phycisphaerales bacterium]|nr:MAG: hypothetical protein EA378_10055 [Phycisphaerales bacterium]